MPRRLLLLVVTALQGCGGCAKEPPKPKTHPPPGSQWETRPGDEVPVPGGQIVVHRETEPGQLNALVYSDAWTHRITLNMIHESLVREDPRAPFGCIPGLAERWDVSPDKLTHTFHLRGGVRWHDGQPFTSRDVRFTFDKLFDPKVRADALRASFEPLGCNWKTPDERTFVIRCRKPHFLFLTNLDDLPILPEHAMAKGDMNTHPRNKEPLGTGPYKFERWVPRGDIVLARNDDYWGKKGYLDRIVYQYLEDAHTAFLLAGKGEIDFVSRVREPDMPAVETEPRFRDHFNRLVDTPNQFHLLVLHCAHPAFSHRLVRRAMAHLFDAEEILTKLMRGLATHIASVYYEGLPGHHEGLIPYPFDPERAKQLFDEAGWKDTDGDGVRDKEGKPFHFTFLYPSVSASIERWATGYQENLKKAGVRMDLAKLDWAVFLERVSHQKFDMAAMSWIFPTPRVDPFDLYHSLPQGGSNYGACKNAEMDRLLESTRSELDEAKRVPLDRHIQEMAYEELPFVPTFRPKLVAIAHKRLHGVSTSPEWYQLNEWWIPKRLQQPATAAK